VCVCVHDVCERVAERVREAGRVVCKHVHDTPSTHCVEPAGVCLAQAAAEVHACSGWGVGNTAKRAGQARVK
jgi:hypothetical protein